MKIIGMEKPKRCWDCHFYDDEGDYPHCIATQTYKGYTFNARTHVMENCPIEDKNKETDNLSEVEE